VNREQRWKAAKKKGKGDRGIGGNNLLTDILCYLPTSGIQQLLWQEKAIGYFL